MPKNVDKDSQPINLFISKYLHIFSVAQIRVSYGNFCNNRECSIRYNLTLY